MGINKCDQAKDEDILDGIHWAVKQRIEDRASLIPKPLAKWGSLDHTGKNFGPVEDIGRELHRTLTKKKSASLERAASFGTPNENIFHN